MSLPAIIDGRDQWASRITLSWQTAAQAFIDTGRLILEAKRLLPYGVFTAMVETDLPFGISAAQRLMRIAEHTLLADPAYRPQLPPSWRTLYELTKLDEPVLLERLRDGSVHPQLKVGEVEAWRQKRSGPMQSKPISKEEPPPTPRRNPRPHIKVPAGQTVSEVCRRGIELEREGVRAETAAKQIGFSLKAYRHARCIVQLADRTDLTPDETALARRACDMLDATRQIKDAYELVRLMVEQVWGKSPRDERAARNRVEGFKTATTIILEACVRGRDMDIPHLTEADAREAIEQIGEAAMALRGLMAKLRRSVA